MGLDASKFTGDPLGSELPELSPFHPHGSQNPWAEVALEPGEAGGNAERIVVDRFPVRTREGIGMELSLASMMFRARMKAAHQEAISQGRFPKIPLLDGHLSASQDEPSIDRKALDPGLARVIETMRARRADHLDFGFGSPERMDAFLKLVEVGIFSNQVVEMIRALSARQTASNPLVFTAYPRSGISLVESAPTKQKLDGTPVERLDWLEVLREFETLKLRFPSVHFGGIGQFRQLLFTLDLPGEVAQLSADWGWFGAQSHILRFSAEYALLIGENATFVEFAGRSRWTRKGQELTPREGVRFGFKVDELTNPSEQK